MTSVSEGTLSASKQTHRENYKGNQKHASTPLNPSTIPLHPHRFARSDRLDAREYRSVESLPSASVHCLTRGRSVRGDTRGETTYQTMMCISFRA
jgi:hypothetical protein